MVAKVTYRDTSKNRLDSAEVQVVKESPEVAIRTFCTVYGFPWWTYILSVEFEDKTYVWKAIAEKAGVKR